MSKNSKVKNAPYLTKRILLSAAKSGVRQAAKETMGIMGYTIIAESGWLIRKYADGHSERIEELEPVDDSTLNLD